MAIPTAEILLVEDSEADAELTRRALLGGTTSHRLHVVENGLDALLFLRREERFAQAPRPDLILLDLDLPGKKGMEVLAEIKEDPELLRIPVVILTLSDRTKADVAACYGLHANGYVVKSTDFAQFIKDLQAIGEFWIKIAKR